MTAVLLGTNRFEECASIIGHHGQQVLGIVDRDGQLQVSLRIPDGGERLRIVDNALEEGSAQVVASPTTVSVAFQDLIVLGATRLGSGTVLMTLDLRPLGLAIYADLLGLHVGSNVLTRNVISGAQIALNLA